MTTHPSPAISPSISPSISPARRRPPAPRPGRRRRAALALAAAGTLVAGTGGTAYAAPTRHEGDLRVAMGYWCDLGYQAATVGSVAGLLYDDAAKPKVGEVFYAYVEVAATAEPCIEQQMVPDIDLPPNLELAVSPAHPIRCVRWDYRDSPVSEHAETALCPTSASPGVSGGDWSFPPRSQELWRLPYQTGWEVQVPVKATAPGPLAVRFHAQVIDGVTDPVLSPLSPSVDVGGGAPASVTTDVAEVVRLGRTGGAVPTTLRAEPAGATVKVVLRAQRDGRWATVASRAASATGSSQTVRVPVPRAWRDRLPTRGLRAKVVVRVRTDSGTGQRAADGFTLRK
ncbi:hypothetical protein [Nocardioides ferulae]|uniref:hypothetical protein n=1 Tax=Nocardioides ferulae TaxID=2340821 RepID=UPI000EB34C2A|nr:hypothetical protein [Nocardioides ferulae]